MQTVDNISTKGNGNLLKNRITHCLIYTGHSYSDQVCYQLRCNPVLYLQFYTCVQWLSSQLTYLSETKCYFKCSAPSILGENNYFVVRVERTMHTKTPQSSHYYLGADAQYPPAPNEGDSVPGDSAAKASQQLYFIFLSVNYPFCL